MPGKASGGVVAITPTDWEAQYERDFNAQKSSGSIIFSEEERRKNRELCSRLRDILPFDDAYKVSDCDLMYRFLIGKHWNVASTEKGMREYARLRKSDDLNNIIGEQLHPTICSVLSPMYKDEPCPIYGLDKEGLPVLWLSPDANKLMAAMKDFTSEQLLRFQLRSMEVSRYVCLQRRVDRCTYVIDLGGITMSSVSKATLALLKGVMNLLQVAYPEIMRRLLIFNTGWAVSAAWKVLRPLVDMRVQDKIKFESGPPTLAVLEQYIAADQVHPSFGGTGSANVLGPIIDAEVRRIRRGVEGRVSPDPAAAAASVVHRPSLESRQSTTLLSRDALTLYSVESTTPLSTACPSPNCNPSLACGGHAEERERVVIGMPSAVTAWLVKTSTASGPLNVLDMSLSVASSSGEYACCRKQASPTPAADDATKRSYRGVASPPSRDPSADGTAAPSREPVPIHATTSIEPTTQQQTELPIVAISLTYGADGSISGYCGRQCVGCFQQGLLYAPATDDDDSAFPRRFPSLLPLSQSSVVGGCAGRSVGVPAGELLAEAGHPLHNFLIVCDAQRRARYLVRESRLRKRLTVYNVVGEAEVHTGKNNRHYVEGERAKLGVVVPHSNATSCGGKEDWMLYGEDVTKRSSRNPTLPLQQLFSKTKRAVLTAKKSRSSDSLDKSQNGRWAASIFAALHFRVYSPAKRKPKSISFMASGSASVPPPSLPDQSGKSCDAVTDDSTQLLAECKGQTVRFYKLSTKNSLPDLFALAVAITQSWSNEMDSCKGKAAASKETHYSSDDDVMP
ncbi:hypothetical protein, conserved [Leishmania donovani]|uniref:CRAL-TRIO domain-containing protein n=1 Tax=Leishmania donovani TaxID=5661 RepID=E9BU68_LEIDO|nr:hypothetical protein, conserved [Leishmania donovani]CBZ38797.1 hypothetical protein, conserved [Leishmania donovani]